MESPLDRGLIDGSAATKEEEPQRPTLHNEEQLHIAIFSFPEELQARNAIRSTWLQTTKGGTIRYQFFVPQTANGDAINAVSEALAAENQQNADMVILPAADPAVDGTRSLEMDHALRWFFESYSAQVTARQPFIIKTDSSSFVFMRGLLSAFGQFSSNSREMLLWAPPGDSDPSVSVRDKLQESRSFVLSLDLLHALISQPQLPLKTVNYIPESSLGIFRCDPKMLVAHDLQPDELILMHQRIETFPPQDWCATLRTIDPNHGSRHSYIRSAPGGSVPHSELRHVLDFLYLVGVLALVVFYLTKKKALQLSKAETRSMPPYKDNPLGPIFNNSIGISSRSKPD